MKEILWWTFQKCQNTNCSEMISWTDHDVDFRLQIHEIIQNAPKHISIQQFHYHFGGSIHSSMQLRVPFNSFEFLCLKCQSTRFRAFDECRKCIFPNNFYCELFNCFFFLFNCDLFTNTNIDYYYYILPLCFVAIFIFYFLFFINKHHFIIVHPNKIIIVIVWMEPPSAPPLFF